MEVRLCCVVVALAVVLELVGFLAASRGIARESFVELARETGGVWDEGVWDSRVWGPGVWDTGQSKMNIALVKAALKYGWLPSSMELTDRHRRENAWSAVFGVALIVVGMLLNAVVKVRRLLSWLGTCAMRLVAAAATRLRHACRRIAHLLAGYARKAFGTDSERELTNGPG
jgi:hypothetical protein